MARSWASCRLVSVIWKRAAISARPVSAARCAAALICSVWVIGVCDMVCFLGGGVAARGSGGGGGGVWVSGGGPAPPVRGGGKGGEQAQWSRGPAGGGPGGGGQGSPVP